MKPLVKICGITNLEDALYAAGLNVWALGFVFADSPRQVSEETARAIIGKLPPYISRVGVFVNDVADNIERIVKSCKLDMVQLHGEEKPQDCKDMKYFAKIIKAFRIKDENSLKIIPDYDVDLCLLDTYSEEKHGGTGKSFNWHLASMAKKYGKKVILAGGLNPKNIVEAVKEAEPYGVDVSTGVEISPGKKDKALMEELVSKIKSM